MERERLTNFLWKQVVTTNHRLEIRLAPFFYAIDMDTIKRFRVQGNSQRAKEVLQSAKRWREIVKENPFRK